MVSALTWSGCAQAQIEAERSCSRNVPFDLKVHLAALKFCCLRSPVRTSILFVYLFCSPSLVCCCHWAIFPCLTFGPGACGSNPVFATCRIRDFTLHRPLCTSMCFALLVTQAACACVVRWGVPCDQGFLHQVGNVCRTMVAFPLFRTTLAKIACLFPPPTHFQRHENDDGLLHSL